MISYQLQRRVKPYLFVMPAVTVLLLIVAYPTIWLVWASMREAVFQRGTFSMEFVGFDQIGSALKSREFLHSFSVSLKYTVASLAAGVGIGLVLALALVELGVRLRGMFLGIILIPWLTPQVVIGLMWRWIFNDEIGVMNFLLRGVGAIDTNILWLSKPKLAMLTVIGAESWLSIPFVTLVLMTALASIPSELLEAAEIDGASYFRRVRSIMIPGIKSSLLVVLIIRTLFAIRAFDLVYSMTRGGPGNATKVLAIRIFDTGVTYFKIGYASAMSMILFFFVIVIVVLYLKLMRQEGSDL